MQISFRQGATEYLSILNNNCRRSKYKGYIDRRLILKSEERGWLARDTDRVVDGEVRTPRACSIKKY